MRFIKGKLKILKGCSILRATKRNPKQLEPSNLKKIWWRTYHEFKNFDWYLKIGPKKYKMQIIPINQQMNDCVEPCLGCLFKLKISLMPISFLSMHLPVKLIFHTAWMPCINVNQFKFTSWEFFFSQIHKIQYECYVR